MADEQVSRIIRVLGVVVGGGFLALGVAELVTRLDDPLVLLFWLPMTSTTSTSGDHAVTAFWRFVVA